LIRQQATPLLLSDALGVATPLQPLSLGTGIDQVSEAEIQALVQAHPQCLPIAEIDPLFAGPIPICTELNTPAGSIDNFLVTPSGLPVLVECKLWRNPEGRREVVGQILDYAKELSRWSSADLQREVRKRLKRDGDPVLEIVREAGHAVDEIAFGEALSINLRRGRFLLLIVGDGIREGVEAIAEYLQAHAGLHFTLGLVELPIYLTPAGDRFIVPRVLVRTHVITRTVVAAPEGMVVMDEASSAERVDEEGDALTADRLAFWTAFVAELTFDDPDQPRPSVSKQGYVYISMPVPGGACWLTAFRTVRDNKVGIYLSYTRNTLGERAVRRVVEDWLDIRGALGGTVILREDGLGRPLIQDELAVSSLTSSEGRETALSWLRKRTNDFVNELRPRIRSALAELAED
jgi:hypothetical protein